MSAHTPGPWTVDRIAVLDEFSKPVALAVPRSMEYCTYANARLIAAAPELLGQHEADMTDLELLAKAIHAGDPMPELVIRVTDMLNRKRPVIAKATQP